GTKTAEVHKQEVKRQAENQCRRRPKPGTDAVGIGTEHVGEVGDQVFQQIHHGKASNHCIGYGINLNKAFRARSAPSSVPPSSAISAWWGGRWCSGCRTGQPPSP